MRAVLDANVLIAALLSSGGSPAELLRRWLGGDFELVVSEKLLAELGRALAYPKIRVRIGAADALAFLQLLRASATIVADVAVAPGRSRDPGDDYLLALAESAAAVVVSGDRDVLALAAQYPVMDPASFLRRLPTGPGG